MHVNCILRTLDVHAFRNTILIHMQKPDATRCAGFTTWKNKFGRHVKKGEKGITILAPTPYKKRIEEAKLDPDTKAPMLDENGKVIMEEKEVQIPMYKPVKTFDISQTEGKPLPQLVSTLTGNVQQYEVFMEALRRTSPVPIEVKPLEENLDGFFSPRTQSITLREGMSQVQTVCAAIHEITHSLLDNNAAPIPEDAEKYQEVKVFDVPALFSNGRIASENIPDGLFRYDLRGSDDDPGMPVSIERRVLVNHAGTIITAQPLNLPESGYLALTADEGLNFTGSYFSIPAFQQAHQRDQNLQEVTAESVSYSVCQYYGIETSANSLGYIATWSKDKDLKELRASLELIGKTASKLISSIDQHYAEICKERGIDPKDLSAPEKAETKPELDEPGRYASDLCAYLEQLYQTGEIDNPFITQSASDLAVEVAELFRKGIFSGIRDELARIAGLTNLPTITVMQERLEQLSDAWDAKLTYRMEQNPFHTDESFLLAYAEENSSKNAKEIIFTGKTEECQKVMQELTDGTVTARRVRALREQQEKEQDIISKPVSVPKLEQQPVPEPQSEPVQEQRLEPVPVTEPEPELKPEPETELFQQMQDTAVEIQNEFSVAGNSETEEKPSPDTTLDVYPVPDKSRNMSDIENAGYLGGDMLPLSLDAAKDLIERDFSVYCLADGGNPEMCFDADDIDERPADAVFALPREEWEASAMFREIVAERMDRQEEREAAFLNHVGDCFAIYQLKEDDDLRGIRYESLEKLQSEGQTPQKDNYDLVYTAPLPEGATLDSLYEQFNNHHPADYQQPSMSMSDIVATKQDSVVSCHYVDRFGFAELKGFLEEGGVQSEIAAGMDAKQPTVAELEAQVKAGQTISLLDLANALQAENQPKARVKRRSVMERLNQPLPKKQKPSQRTALKRSAGKER